MRGNTVVMFVIALVFGAVAVFFANAWLKGQEARQAVQQPTIAPAQVETSTIVVAARDLSFGEQLNADVLREIPWPKSAIPDGAYAKVSELTSDGRRLVLTPISPNEPVLKWKISGPDARASLSALVTPGMRAVGVRINEAASAGGFVLPGDHVDVLYTHSGSGNDQNSTTDILIQNVRVLAVERVADQKKSDPIVGNTATIEVTTLDAEKIALAQTTGSLSLTLRSAGSLDQAPAQRVVEQELVSSPSVYQTTFDAQAEAQAKLDKRLKGLEGSVSTVEQNLRGEMGQTTEILKSKLAALEESVKQTARATGQDEEELRKKLAELGAAIDEARGASGQGEDALRKKLAEFQDALARLASSSNQPTVIPVAEVEEVSRPVTATIGVTRGIDRKEVQVPLDITNN